MLSEGTEVFSMLAKPIRDAIKEKGFIEPTEPQRAAIPLILEGKNVLLIAPTASGKTESAVLPILSLHISSRETRSGIRILYITPLRALNRDLLERLEWWCSRVDVKIAVRHGDTEIRERGRQAKSPPDMLITTPETLQAILPGRIMRRHLAGVRWVIVDEVHELAEDKRGSQLSLGLERLRWISGSDFQLVGLSATVGSADSVAQYLVGASRKVEVVKVPVARKMRLEVRFPQPTPADYALASRLYTHPEVAARLRLMRSLIQNHRSVLLFTNTRAIAEVLASRFKVWDVDFPVSIHHGSLSKPSRITAERGLKEGELRGLVCTSSLELGIDVGRIDFVIQYMSPRQVTRLIQRVGRSGHSFGQTADGVIISMDSDDTLEALAIARRTYEEILEPVSIPEKPLDALTHQIVGLLTQQRRWYFNEILELFTRAYPYRNLTEDDIKNVVTYMHARYPRLAWVSFQDKVVLRPQRIKDMYEYYFNKLSMIPDEKQYLIVDEATDAPVGVLDEAFVAEYGIPDTKFIMRGSAWKILRIRGDKIHVRPISDPSGAIPSWIGEEIPVPFEVAQEVGQIRGLAAEKYRATRERMKIAEELSKTYPANPETIQRALQEVFDQVDRGIPVPSDRLITIEEWEDYIIINANLGTLVNRTLARLLGHILSEETGYTIGVQQDAYRIILQTTGAVTPQGISELLRALPDRDIETELRKALMKTGLFKRRLVHVARRFGAISRKVDFSSLRLDQLMKTLEGTVVVEESLRETLEKDSDLPHMMKVLRDIRDGIVQVQLVEGKGEATPITRIGIERISRRTDLIPPEKMKRILIESTRVRIMNEARTFVCTRCLQHVEMRQLKELPPRPRCPKCKSRQIGMLSISEDEALALMAKRDRNLSGRDREMLELARETAGLIEQYGRAAAYVLAGRRVDPMEAEMVLQRERHVCDRLFELIMEAERNALRDRFL
jgi:ATP-dependent Lhr-like helicase